jgi:hypothetical protein
VIYRDWSFSFQLKGTVGLRKLVSMGFEMTSLDEFRTSRALQLCLRELTRYRKKQERKAVQVHAVDAKPRFVDRDKNAAANILLTGESHERP